MGDHLARRDWETDVDYAQRLLCEPIYRGATDLEVAFDASIDPSAVRRARRALARTRTVSEIVSAAKLSQEALGRKGEPLQRIVLDALRRYVRAELARRRALEARGDAAE